MARGFYLGIDGVARAGSEIYAGASGVARSVVKVYASVNGVAEQVWTQHAWKRYSLKDSPIYNWDKYNAIGTTSYTGDVVVTNRSASMAVSWSPRFPRNDPPKINKNSLLWDNLGSGNWNGATGDWIVRSSSLSNSCYFVSRVEGLEGSDVKFYFSKVATAATRTTYTKGETYKGQTSSKNQNEFPADGAYGGVWYTSAETTYEKAQGDYIDTVYGDEGEYPDNGILGDYWYVKVEQ